MQLDVILNNLDFKKEGLFSLLNEDHTKFTDIFLHLKEDTVEANNL